MNSMGVVGCGGIGKHLTEWIIDGAPSVNLATHDILRFVEHHNNRKFLKERVKETICKYSKIQSRKLHFVPYSIMHVVNSNSLGLLSDKLNL